MTGATSSHTPSLLGRGDTRVEARPCQGWGVMLPLSHCPVRRQPVAKPTGNMLLPSALSHAPNLALSWARGKVTRPWCCRSTCWWSPRTPTAPATSGRSLWTSPTTSSATAPPRATTLGGRGPGRVGGAGAGPRQGGRGRAWGQGQQGAGRPGAASPAARHPAPAARPSSAAMLLPPCLSSTTTGLSLAAATKRAPRAPRARPSGASVPAVPTSLAETAPAVPPATGASPAAGVSTSVHGLPGEEGDT